MAAAHSRQLSRLHIPPGLGQQQPFVYGDNAPLYSPALPTAIQVGVHNSFPMQHGHFPLQTPMQANFFPRQPPGAPQRPSMHRAHPSVVQLAAAGILPPPGIPMTPLGPAGFPPPMLPPQPFVPKSKRTQSVSTGGPPKAVLGGPQRKVSPLPPVAPVAPVTQPVKTKKVVVNLPKETVHDGDNRGPRQPRTRKPIPNSQIPPQPVLPLLENTTAEAYPPDAWRHHIPPTVDVFLPGKAAWQTIKQKAIEEKLEKLGVERGSGSAVPHIHAPHARAASISSPADPALLYFKLNKLQQSQNASASGSLVPSPQPSSSLSPSPGIGLPPRLQNRHGYSMSLAQPPSLYNPTAAFNPFGPSATLGSDQILPRASPGLPAITATSEEAPLHAPQGRVPTNVSSLAPPPTLSRPESRPDFMRGFGLDVTEEVDEPVDEPPAVELDRSEGEEPVQEASDITEASQEVNVDELGGDETIQDSVSTVAQSRIHSRHVSKLSAALSLRSVGRVEDTAALLSSVIPEVEPSTETTKENEGEDVDGDAAAEWTGSEDIGITSDDESIGEWSNPSDEERARQERLNRRILRKSRLRRNLEAPRRLPNFPRPPKTYAAGDVHPDDDVISNPSDEEHEELRDHFMDFEGEAHLSRPASNRSPVGRPLPPLPHSRTSSAHFSYHDPALAHSREGSDQFMPGGLQPRPPRSESLNPLAKPFVFGHTFGNKTLPPVAGSVVAPSPPTHTRVPSVGKPLNVAAPEFKPGGFTFQPPPGVPQLTFPAVAAIPRPLPELPVAAASPIRATQGREKRQRRGSAGSLAEEEEGKGNDTMASFKFPVSGLAAEMPAMRHSAPASPPAHMGAFPSSAKTFTFAGFSSAMAFDDDGKDIPDKLIAAGAALGDEDQEVVQEVTIEPEAAQELPFPPTAKPKRAPIPLDFKHPISQNTVPAGLFKALVNGDDERTRRSVRSRLSSRDIFEHSPRPSLDDLSMPTISQRKTRNRLFTDPGLRDQSPEEEDIFGIPRRSSLPPRRGHGDSSGSEMSLAPMNLSRRVEMQQYEQRLEVLLDEKVDGIKKALDEFKKASGGQNLSASAEAMISEVVSLFRTQLQDSAARGLDESQADARGDFDFEMLKDIIEQSHAEARNVLQRDLEEFIHSSRTKDVDFKRFAEDLAERTVKAVLTATGQMTMHLHTMDQSRGSFAAEREAIVHDVVASLTPTLLSMQPEPVDYDGLTAQLSQAVKPHISQLIDLASDKRETAGLIVERLVPILPSLYPPTPAFDLEGAVGRLSAEMRKIIGPLDAHEIKEQVSDLVVERLDSRLAVRDRTLTPDSIADRVTDSVKSLFQPLQHLQASVDLLGQKDQAVIPPPVLDLTGIRNDISTLLADLPSQLGTATSALEQAQSEFKQQQEQLSKDDKAWEHISHLQDTLEQVAEEHKQLVSQNAELSDFCQDIVKHIDALPEAMVEATKVLQNAHADIIERDTSKKDAEEIRRLMNTNAELQVQLAKARGAHGQVRVEKDSLADRLRVLEAERDEMRSKMNELESTTSEKSAAASAVEAKNVELETALAQALERIKSSDVSAQEVHGRVSELEKKNNEVVAENQQLQAKIDKLDMGALIAAREKEMLSEELSSVKKQNEDLKSQQSSWEELRHATEQIQSLAAKFGQIDNEEVKELRQLRDKYKTLESDHATLQRRLKDQDNKMANSERAAAAARQSLSNAQERAVEWEKRAKEYESDLRSTRTKLDELEQAHFQLESDFSQLEADYSLSKLQVEERGAEERLIKDRESKLRDQIASMEAQLARVQAEADKANSTVKTSHHHPPQAQFSSRIRQNGYIRAHHTPARPDSRASTAAFGDHRARTPTIQTNGTHYTSSRAPSPPQPSVWDSMHAPRAKKEDPIRLPMTPTASRPQSYYRPQIPSPTPSNVSAAPTLGADGWWE